MSLILNPHYWIGVDKPKVQYIKEFYKQPSMFEDSDNMANDPEQNWDDNETLKTDDNQNM